MSEETHSFARELQVTYKGQPYKFPGRVTTSRHVDKFCRSRLKLNDRPEEHFYALLLNAKNAITGWSLVSKGSIMSCPVIPQDAFRSALLTAAVGVIFVHNHPSGEPTPSPDDIALTEKLCSVGKILGVRLVDHVIIGEPEYFSFLDAGLLQPK